jgi:hypothetical protein
MARRPLRRAAALVALGVGLLPAGTLASGQPPLAIVVGSSATLEHDGLTAFVPVTVTCTVPAVRTASVAVDLRQARDGWIASGFGIVEGGVVCSGQPETVVVTVEAYGPGPTFGDGRALATAYVDVAGGDPAAPATQSDRLADQIVEVAAAVPAEFP